MCCNVSAFNFAAIDSSKIQYSNDNVVIQIAPCSVLIRKIMKGKEIESEERNVIF